MHFFPFLFDTRPTSLFLLRRSSMLPPSSGANTWTWNDVTLKILGRLLHIFYCFLHERTSSYSSIFCEWQKKKKKLFCPTETGLSILLPSYLSCTSQLFCSICSFVYIPGKKKRMDIFVMCTLGCFFLVYISDVFSQWGYCLPHLQFSFLCYIFRLYLLILGWLCEFIIILLQRTGWACMYKVYYSLLSIMVIDWKKKKNKKWK